MKSMDTNREGQETHMQGMLYLCATPIGNLEDITMRVIRTLKEVDVIAAEDTRNTIRLLNHFQIHTPMTSYHEYNKIEKAYDLIGQMKKGKQIALVTDAGTPGISDPGEELVRMCHEEGIMVTSLPGAAACVTALTLSGLPTRRFCFEAFLPRDKKECAQILEELKMETRTIVLYEAPHHLRKTLDLLYKTLGNRKLTLCRELTKKYETIQVTDLKGAMEYYEKEELRGEFVLVLEGKSRQEKMSEERRKWEKLTIQEHMEYYLEQGMEKKEAMKRVAVDRKVGKREVYQALLAEKKETVCDKKETI